MDNINTHTHTKTCLQGHRSYSVYMERIGGEPNHRVDMLAFIYRLAANGLP